MLLWKGECAAKVFEKNGLSGRIHWIPKHSGHLRIGSGGDMPTKANILVAEIFDSQLIGEDALETFNDANKRLLTVSNGYHTTTTTA